MKFERTAAALELVCVCYSSRDGMKKYAVAYEQAPGNWAAYVPGLPACITTGSTLAQTSRNIREAMELHSLSVGHYTEADVVALAPVKQDMVYSRLARRLPGADPALDVYCRFSRRN